MTYRETIEQNKLCYSPKWWTSYAFHYTDASNAVSILSSGVLYSRMQAETKGVMQNDNASRQVIDMTDAGVKSCVRFYFRPLTPTQYHNEGYKHPKIRYNGDQCANVPIPVFLLFDLERLLQLDLIEFSEVGQAGYGTSPLFHGEEAFARLPFGKIYSDGPTDRATRKYRHAELLYPNAFSIDSIVKYILCRNACEKQTFLNLLKEKDGKAFEKYRNIVRLSGGYAFQRNGLFVENVLAHDRTIVFKFANTLEKKRYVDRYVQRYGDVDIEPLRGRFKFDWMKGGIIITSLERIAAIDYLKAEPVEFRVPHIDNADILKVTFWLEGDLLCLAELPLDDYELL